MTAFQFDLISKNPFLLCLCVWLMVSFWRREVEDQCSANSFPVSWVRLLHQIWKWTHHHGRILLHDKDTTTWSYSHINSVTPSCNILSVSSQGGICRFFCDELDPVGGRVFSSHAIWDPGSYIGSLVLYLSATYLYRSILWLQEGSK